MDLGVSSTVSERHNSNWGGSSAPNIPGLTFEESADFVRLQILQLHAPAGLDFAHTPEGVKKVGLEQKTKAWADANRPEKPRFGWEWGWRI